MQYLGGKSKIRKEMSKFLESVRLEGQTYFEPFCGGGWVLQEMSGERIASDGNKALISMYQALQDGWIPPDFVSEDDWRKWRQTKEVVAEPMMAFARFGCGFGGDWNGGYARSEGKSCYAATSKRSLLRQLPLIADVEFVQGCIRNIPRKECSFIATRLMQTRHSTEHLTDLTTKHSGTRCENGV